MVIVTDCTTEIQSISAEPIALADAKQMKMPCSLIRQPSRVAV